jgi:hypothetical protein
LACNQSTPATTTEKKIIQNESTKNENIVIIVDTLTPREIIWTKYALPEDFTSFYTKFLKEKTFQLSRIKFPLKGFNTDVEEENDNPDSEYYWQKDTWNYMVYGGIDTTQYIVEYKVQGVLITEKISLKDSGFYTICQFEKLSGDWTLVYYGLHNL